MKKTLLLLVLLGVVGSYLGWFVFTTSETPDRKRNVNVVIDTDKLKADKERALRRLRGEADRLSDQAGDAAESRSWQ